VLSAGLPAKSFDVVSPWHTVHSTPLAACGLAFHWSYTTLWQLEQVSRPESADGKYAWLDPAEQWLLDGNSQNQKTNRVRPNMRAQNYSRTDLLSTVFKYRTGDGCISDTHHISPECDLRTGCEAFCKGMFINLA